MKEMASHLNISERDALYHWGVIKGIIGLRDVALLSRDALKHGVAEWQVEV